MCSTVAILTYREQIGPIILIAEMNKFGTANHLNKWQRKKRILDVGLISIVLPLVLVVCFVVAISIRWKLGAPVLFSQIRPGRGGVPFRIYKFRSMLETKDQKGHLLSDEDRTSAFGSFLRSSSLDELPALWNVLAGDMSLVGPRPLLPEYLQLYTSEQARRHNALPGITGLAQVNGRNALSWEEKFKLDVWYVDNATVLLDIKILMLTVVKVFKREGISAVGEFSMSKFKGDKKD